MNEREKKKESTYRRLKWQYKRTNVKEDNEKKNEIIYIIFPMKRREVMSGSYSLGYNIIFMFFNQHSV